MMDPNLSFDWDQWDAVFGQQIPMAEELIELDPVAGGLGLGLTDPGIDLLTHTIGNASGIGIGNEPSLATTPSVNDMWRDFE